MDQAAPFLVWTIFAVCVAIGLAGAIVPALPGTPLIYAGIFLVAWWYDFQVVGTTTLSVTGVLAVLGLLVDTIASVVGAKKVGASRQALIGSAIGGFLGVFFLLPGIILGPFLGALAGELWAERDLAQATRVGIGTWLGMLLGMAAKIGISLAMLGAFALAFI